MIYFAIAVFAVLLLFDLPALIREKKRKELIVYSVLSVITLTYWILYSLKIDVFSPIESMLIFVDKTLGLNYELWQGHS